jgi:hypothetical protein
VTPELRGYTFTPEERHYTDVQTINKNQNFEAVKAISAPLNLTGKRIENRGLFVREQIVVLNWSPNPVNAAIPITAYRIYDATSTPDTFLAEVSASILEHMQRNVTDSHPRTFQVVAVDAANREGVPASVTV